MGDDVSIEHFPGIDFQVKELASTMTLMAAKSVRVGQYVTVKAKVTKLGEQEQGGNLRMVKATLVDPTASMKIVFWEDFINKVENNGTYLFHNLKVRIDKYSEKIYLNTAQQGTTIEPTDPFTEILAIDVEDPTEFVTTTVHGEFLGINYVHKYLSCCKCRKKVQATTSLIVECQSCHLKQKLKASIKHWYAQVLFEYDSNKKVTLTLFEEAIKQALTLAGKETQSTNFTEECILEALLELPTITVTFNNKNKVVTKIVAKE